MNKTIAYLCAALCICIGVIAGMMIRQTTAQTFGQTIIVATCGSGITFTAGTFGQITEDTTGKLCTSL